MKLIKEKKGQISIDFLTAISIFLITFFFIIYSLSGIVDVNQNNRDIYPDAERISNYLTKNPGLKKENDTCWEQWWSNNSEEVSRIGFSAQEGEKPPTNYSSKDRSIHYVLSYHKIGSSDINGLDGALEKHGDNQSNYWWSFGENYEENEYEALKEALNLYPEYDVYLQIRPLNSDFSKNQANNEINESVPKTNDVVKIEKIVYVQKYDSENNEWVYLENTENEVIKYSFLIWVW